MALEGGGEADVREVADAADAANVPSVSVALEASHPLSARVEPPDRSADDSRGGACYPEGGAACPEVGATPRPENSADSPPENDAAMRPENAAALRPEIGAESRPEVSAVSSLPEASRTQQRENSYRNSSLSQVGPTVVIRRAF